MNPVPRIGKDMNEDFPLDFVSSSRGKAFELLYDIRVPSVALLCTYNVYLHPVGWLFQQRPIVRLAERFQKDLESKNVYYVFCVSMQPI